MAGMSALQATLKKFEAEAAKMAAMKKDMAASRSGKPPPAKKARKTGGGEGACSLHSRAISACSMQGATDVNVLRTPPLARPRSHAAARGRARVQVAQQRARPSLLLRVRPYAVSRSLGRLETL